MQETYWEKHLRRIKEEGEGVGRKASDPDVALIPTERERKGKIGWEAPQAAGP